ncbi:MAG: hypothetical protein JWO25_2183 [Alphaproteobacteria bacterium]|nr:hypothetical protein [Alphaproteobacteria bacterium]
MKLIVSGLVAIAAATGGVQAWDWSTASDEISNSPEYASSKAVCRRLRDREPPPADAPDKATAATLKGCSSEALYYGIGVKADPVRARQCAFLEAETGGDDAPFSGRTMLMIIYANGVGARRDLDVATHLACGIEGAAMESHGRVTHLAGLEAKGWKGSDFGFCDDVTSGLAMGYCASHDADIQGAKRNSALAALTHSWSAAERQAFEPLEKAHAAFVDAHGEGEVDLSGTARAAIEIGEEQALRDELLAMLTALQDGRAPVFTAAQYRAADAALNAGYRAFLASPDVGADYAGAVSRDGVRAAQRAWLRYRDAFLAFAAVKYPHVPRDSLATWITRKRSAMWKSGT